MVIKIKVTPNCKKAKIAQVEHEKLDFKISLTSSPAKGKANKELTELISSHFKVPRYKVIIKKGYKNRNKIILIER